MFRIIYNNINSKIYKSAVASSAVISTTLFSKSFCTSNSKSNVSNVANEINTCILPAKIDTYNGVNINLMKLNEIECKTSMISNPIFFHTSLKNSLATWREKRYRGVWLKIPSKLSELIPIAIKEGFQFHHAEKEYIMLNYWLPSGSNQMPANASHQVGVGCIVLPPIDHEIPLDIGKNMILTVQERRGVLRGKGIWKLPTGLVDVGEDLGATAVREVMEETGVVAEFKGIASFRHSHEALHGKSDLFFICILQAKSMNINISENEILAAKWIELDEYTAQNRYKTSELYNLINKIIVDVASNPINNNSNDNNNSKDNNNIINNIPIKESVVAYGTDYPIRKSSKTCSVYHI